MAQHIRIKCSSFIASQVEPLTFQICTIHKWPVEFHRAAVYVSVKVGPVSAHAAHFWHIFNCIKHLLSRTFDITMAVFDVAQTVVNRAGGIISGNTNIDITSTIAAMQTQMQTMELGGLVQLALETMIISLCLKIMSILITVILYGRMIEIYLTVSVAPVPFATMTNREWGNIGTNYFKSLFALGFQGFFMMVCVAIYAVLVNSMTVAADIHAALFSIAAYTVILCFSLMKTGSLSKSIFGAH